MSDVSFNRLTAGIIDTMTAMRDQVKIFGNLPCAMQKGYEPVLMKHLLQIRGLCSAIENLIKESNLDGSYSVVADSHRLTVSLRTKETVKE